MTFLDTNVFLDLLANRSPWHDQANKLVKLHIEQTIEIGLSVISVPVLFFLLRKHHKSVAAKDVLNEMLSFLTLLDVSGGMSTRAIKGKWSDIEDAIQYECALYYEASCIVTRNKKDFTNSKLPVLSPAEWLEEFNL